MVTTCPNRHVLHVVGARPNLMKMAPLVSAFDADPGGFTHCLVHTGQHYDEHLNDAIFRDLSLRAPDIHLGVGSGSHAEQTGRVMVEFEKVVREIKPSLVVVAGDVNSTLGCSLVAAKACVPVAHVESGLRSFDMTMPEEVNRVVTDRLASLLLTPSSDADSNLLREGVPSGRIVRVGNLMVDSVMKHLARARSGCILGRFGLSRQRYAVVTLHRPSNVDNLASLIPVLHAIAAVSRMVPVVFPVHPRTRAKLALAESARTLESSSGIVLTEPLGYLDFLQLEDSAALVLTDSGGIQEETTVLGVPCLTLRENTERPITTTEGTNELVGTNPDRIVGAAQAILEGRSKEGRIPMLWDGQAGARAATAIRRFLA